LRRPESKPVTDGSLCYKDLALASTTADNHGDRNARELESKRMVALNGLEKFSHLEDKIYRTIELTKTLRQEKEELERQLATYGSGDKQQLGAQLQRLQAERDLIRAKVEKILDTIATVDPEIAEAIR
jgi:hypothetical protein